jgi:hypothetical protein
LTLSTSPVESPAATDHRVEPGRIPVRGDEPCALSRTMVKQPALEH